MNGQGHQQGFMPFPFFGSWPPFQQPQQIAEAGQPPARVRIALEFLTNLSSKTMLRAAANDLSIEVIPGQDLTSNEKDAQLAACDMLADYFGGRLKQDIWEKAEFDMTLRRIGSSEMPGVIIRCVLCAPGPGRVDCGLCRGTGSLLIFPSLSQPSVGND